MGNLSSRKGCRPKSNGTAVQALNKIEENRGPGVDSYDKLIAWMVEMAENDSTDLDTSTFINQISGVCQNARHKLKKPPIRQHSASCDSNVSSDTPYLARSSKSFDDSLDPKAFGWRPVNSRQTTFSDEGEENDVVNASRDSLVDGYDSTNEFDRVDPSEVLLKPRKGGGSFPIARKHWLHDAKNKKINGVSVSVGDLVDVPQQLYPSSRRKSSSMATVLPSVSPENDDELSADNKANNGNILDDCLLDQNIADILFSVETLWPKQ